MKTIEKIFQYCLFLFLGFLLLYIDGQESEGGMSIGQIWKIPVLLFLLYKVVLNLRHKFIKFRFGYALIKILNKDTIINLLGNASNVLRFMALPLFLSYLEKNMKKDKAIKVLLYIAHVLVLSFLPYSLGLLEQSHSYIGASILGVDSLIGPFLNAHTASVYLSSSLIVILFYLRYCKMPKEYVFFNVIILLLGSYFLYETYVRTGYLMFVIGAFIVLLPRKGLLKQITYSVFVVFTSYLLFMYFLSTEDIFMQRLYEQSETGYEYENNEEVTGSGRVFFWKTSYNLWRNSDDAWHFLFGYGYNRLEEQQLLENNLRIGSHNGFLDALSQNGLIGFILFLLFYIYLFKYNYNYRRSKYYWLFLSWYVSNLSFQVVQGGVFIFYDLLSAFIILLPKIDFIESKRYIIENKE